MFRASVLEKIKTHFVFSDFFPENHAFNEVMWRNMAQPDMAAYDCIIRRMRFACAPTKARIQTHILITNLRINMHFAYYAFTLSLRASPLNNESRIGP
jgi:hypothetical protein